MPINISSLNSPEFEVPNESEIDLIKTNIDFNIEAMNAEFGLINTLYTSLSTEVAQNEVKKRELKGNLLKGVFKLLYAQTAVTFLIFILILGGIILSGTQVGLLDINLSQDTINNLIKFVTYYITTVVAEVLGMLYFIVKNVFNESITELFNNFKDLLRKEESK